MLEGARVVVTGASRGLGRAYACALAAHGAKLVIAGRAKAELAESRAAASNGGMADVEMFVGEVEDDQAARALVETAVDHYGGVDVVVNNAGVVHQKVLAKMTPAEFDEEIAVNLRGTWSVSRHAIAAMKESGGGLLLQIASQSAFTGTIGQTGYAASKAGVIGMMCAARPTP